MRRPAYKLHALQLGEEAPRSSLGENEEAKEGVWPLRWSSALAAPCDQSLQVGVEAFLVRLHPCGGRVQEGGEGRTGPQLLCAAARRRGNLYMSSLALVITLARITSAEGGGGAVAWKEEGEVPAWLDGGRSTETWIDNTCWGSAAKPLPEKIF